MLVGRSCFGGSGSSWAERRRLKKMAWAVLIKIVMRSFLKRLNSYVTISCCKVENASLYSAHFAAPLSNIILYPGLSLVPFEIEKDGSLKLKLFGM